MGWVWLAIACVCEIGWVIGLKLSDGLTRPWPTAFTIPVMLASFVFLAFAMKSLPMGTAYATWTGVGAVGVAIIGMYYFQEPHNLLRLFSIVLIILGVVGLKASS